MSGGEWRDARVRHAEAALADAVRTADEVIAEAVEAATESAERRHPVERDDPPPQTILRDAW